MSRFDEWREHLRETGNADLESFGFVIVPMTQKELLGYRGIAFRECTECGGVIHLPCRDDKKYCSELCNRAAYQRRQRERRARGVWEDQ